MDWFNENTDRHGLLQLMFSFERCFQKKLTRLQTNIQNAVMFWFSKVR